MEAADRGSVPTAPVVAVIAVLGAVAGLLGSILGPYYPMIVGALLIGAGLLLRRRSAASALLLAFGVSVIAGVLMYVLLGLLGQGAPGSGEG